jgi:hypothetical protein
VLEVVHDRLLTPVGLRSLSRDSRDYKPKYFGDLRARDAAYHQGTVWAWLIGPFIDAWLKVHQRTWLGLETTFKDLAHTLDEACIGSIQRDSSTPSLLIVRAGASPRPEHRRSAPFLGQKPRSERKSPQHNCGRPPRNRSADGSPSPWGPLARARGRASPTKSSPALNILVPQPARTGPISYFLCWSARFLTYFPAYEKFSRERLASLQTGSSSRPGAILQPSAQ